MTTGLPALLGSALSDALSIFQLAGTSVSGAIVQSAISTFLRRRLDEAHDILLEEFRKARLDKIHLGSEYEMGGVLFRYFNAIRENAARHNLNLMAQVMVGLAQRDQLFADDFTRYANILSTLSRDEVLAIALLHQAQISFTVEQGSAAVWKRLLENSVPKYFPTEEYLQAVLSGASKSGLILSPQDIFAIGIFKTSPLMDEVSKLADFDAALHRGGFSPFT